MGHKRKSLACAHIPNSGSPVFASGRQQFAISAKRYVRDCIEMFEYFNSAALLHVQNMCGCILAGSSQEFAVGTEGQVRYSVVFVVDDGRPVIRTPNSHNAISVSAGYQ